MLSGHGCFRTYLYKIKYEDSPKCQICSGLEEDAEHVFFACPRFNTYREALEAITGDNITPENIVPSMLSSEEVWEAAGSFATGVIKELRREEQKRKKRKEAEGRSLSEPQTSLHHPGEVGRVAEDDIGR